ncbi:WD repeat-containing protein 43 [Macrosteles quadrilineatus]|uniref:WD repeat-containing protein 43 n=1 Tax=Macrosteles quadrilineatus TaxID=74068 RepID=UPI0023E27589|nr:WD repeat-containing protein 43 [Macrosteles quadrilineatus]
MVLEYSSFSNCGNLYAHCGTDGKLKLWDTGTGNFKQEYTPNLHLSSPYTCLIWISSDNVGPQQKKRKKRSDGQGGSPLVVLGTQSGSIVVYSVAEGSIVSSLNDGHKSPVLCLSWEKTADLFSCTTDKFVHWDVTNKTMRSKWKNGENITAMAVTRDGEMLITAARSIKCWNVATQTVVKSFIGHASPVFRLLPVSSSTGDNYLISAAQNDRLLSAWCLSASADSNAVGSFLLSDLARSVSVDVTDEGLTNVVTVTQSGVLHLFSHQLNGKSKKPLKPKVTVTIAADTGQSKTKVLPLPVLSAQMRSQLRAHIVYGQPPFLAFETIKLEHPTNELCLVRKDPKISLTARQEAVTKVRAPEVGKDVQYVSVNGSLGPVKRKGKESDVPMEQRLENLALNQPAASPSSQQTKGESMAHLLLQGLQSKDKNILQTVLFGRDEAVIAQTVQRLPVQVISPLVKELTVLLQGKTFTNQVAATWLKAVLAAHAGQLLADPEAVATVAPLLGMVETRRGVVAPLSRLRGRLDLLLHQVSVADRHTTAAETLPLVVLHDQDSTEEGSDTFGSEEDENDSEERWDELSDDEPEVVESEDVEMSS